MQAEVNIGTVGHVDHGKTSVVKALTGKWTETHSEELKRGITIRIGYADADFYSCPKCGQKFSLKENCACGGKGELLRRVSFLDAPGHETLMTTTIAASSFIDGALLVIAANEPCPQAQTLEHLMILDILGKKNIIVIQNKIDLVSKEKALENYRQIKAFLSGTIAENAPIIPLAANYGTNIHALIEAIQEYIPTPKRNLEAPPRMYITRSFDVNRPGTPIEKLKGGVLGGSLIQGVLHLGDEIEIRPGIARKVKDKELVEPVIVEVSYLQAGGEYVEEVCPGGLIGIGTKLDPALTKGDSLVGNLLGKPGTLPEVSSEIETEFNPIKRVDFENAQVKVGEPLVLSVGTSTSLGVITKIKGNSIFLKLKRPICADKGSKLALSRRIGQRWRLAGWGVLK